MIEAMASGTPTIAYRRGSVAEVIEHGMSGIIVDDEDGAVQAVRTIERIDRGMVRKCLERRFTAERMADDYFRLYESLPLHGELRAA
jgi:glycosyltransferase involved in cell wall biosynthesis